MHKFPIQASSPILAVSLRFKRKFPIGCILGGGDQAQATRLRNLGPGTQAQAPRPRHLSPGRLDHPRSITHPQAPTDSTATTDTQGDCSTKHLGYPPRARSLGSNHAVAARDDRSPNPDPHKHEFCRTPPKVLRTSAKVLRTLDQSSENFAPKFSEL